MARKRTKVKAGNGQFGGGRSGSPMGQFGHKRAKGKRSGKR